MRKLFSLKSLPGLLIPKEVLEEPGANWRQKTLGLIKHELKANTSPQRAALSLAAGVALGLSPFHGLQMIILLAMSYPFRLNRPLAILGVNVSCAPLIPFIIIAEIAMGELIVPKEYALISFNSPYSDLIATKITAFLAGSIVLSLAGGALAYLLGRLLFTKLAAARMAREDKNAV